MIGHGGLLRVWGEGEGSTTTNNHLSTIINYAGYITMITADYW